MLFQSSLAKETALGSPHIIYDPTAAEWESMLMQLAGEEAEAAPDYYDTINPAGLTYPRPLRTIRNLIYGKQSYEDAYSVFNGSEDWPAGRGCFRVQDPHKPLAQREYRTLTLDRDKELFEDDTFTAEYVVSTYLQAQLQFEELVEAVIDATQCTNEDDGVDLLEHARKQSIRNTSRCPDLVRVLHQSDQNTEEMWLAHAIYSVMRNKSLVFNAAMRKRLNYLAEETFVAPFVDELKQEEKITIVKRKQREEYDYSLQLAADGVQNFIHRIRAEAEVDPGRIRELILQITQNDQLLTAGLIDVIGFHTVPGRSAMGILRACRVYNLDMGVFAKAITTLDTVLFPALRVPSSKIDDLLHHGATFFDLEEEQPHVTKKRIQPTDGRPSFDDDNDLMPF